MSLPPGFGGNYRPLWTRLPKRNRNSSPATHGRRTSTRSFRIPRAGGVSQISAGPRGHAKWDRPPGRRLARDIKAAPLPNQSAEARRGTRQRCPETSWLVGSLEESQPPPRVHAIVTSQLLRWRTAREAWTRVSTPGVSTFFCDFPVAKAPAPHLVLARRRKRLPHDCGKPWPNVETPCVDMSVDAARTSAQCHLVFPSPDTCMNCGADAPVCSRPPGRLRE